MILCSLTPNGETDNNSLHGSCPTTKGEKWSATKWIHVGPFGGSAESARAKWCVSPVTTLMIELRILHKENHHAYTLLDALSISIEEKTATEWSVRSLWVALPSLSICTCHQPGEADRGPSIKAC